MTNLKKTLQDYSELEFLVFLNEFFENPSNLKGKQQSEHISRLTVHFNNIVKHPEKSALIFYPRPGVEDSPEAVIAEIKAWCAANGKPGFREEQ